MESRIPIQQWKRDGWWYKADRTGYEGLSEVIVSKMLHYSSLSEKEYVSYEPEVRVTGIRDFISYMNKVMTVDAISLNEDRHLHNIAVILNTDETYSLCPIFDQGAGLLSDTSMDYPMGEDVWQLMDSVKAKTFSSSFDEQLDIAECLAGNQLKFYFTKANVKAWFKDEVVKSMYSSDIRERVMTIVYGQMRKYAYLFVD